MYRFIIILYYSIPVVSKRVILSLLHYIQMEVTEYLERITRIQNNVKNIIK